MRIHGLDAAQVQAAGPYTPFQGRMKTGRLHPSATGTCPPGSVPGQGVHGAAAGLRTLKLQSRLKPLPQKEGSRLTPLLHAQYPLRLDEVRAVQHLAVEF